MSKFVLFALVVVVLGIGPGHAPAGSQTPEVAFCAVSLTLGHSNSSSSASGSGRCDRGMTSTYAYLSLTVSPGLHCWHAPINSGDSVAASCSTQSLHDFNCAAAYIIGGSVPKVGYVPVWDPQRVDAAANCPDLTDL